VAKEQFPLGLKGVLVVGFVGDFVPVAQEVCRVFHIGIPDGVGRLVVALLPAASQGGQGGTFGAVYLQGEQVVASNASAPRGVEVGDDAIGQLECDVGGVVGGALIGLALFVDSLGNVGSAEATDGLYGSEEGFEQVAEVAEHVEDDAAAVLFAVVPGRSLALSAIALEDPVAELTSHGEDASQEACLQEVVKFLETGEPEFVLDDAGFEFFLLGELMQRQGVVSGEGCWFFAVDVLACSESLLDRGRAAIGGLGVEIDFEVVVFQGGVEVGGPGVNVCAVGQVAELVGIAADEHGFGYEVQAVGSKQAALVADGADGP